MAKDQLNKRDPEMSRAKTDDHEIAMVSGLITQHVALNHRGELASFLESLYTHMSKVLPVDPDRDDPPGDPPRDDG